MGDYKTERRTIHHVKLNAMGRPSKYSPELVEDICAKLSKGIPLAQICREEGMPGVQTVRDWMNADEAISVAIARAREDGEDAIAAQVLEIIDTPPERVQTQHGSSVIDGGDVANRKLRAEYRLKLLAKWNPKRWGDRVDVTSNGKGIPPCTIVVPPYDSAGD
jgi:hypothetical protein